MEKTRPSDSPMSAYPATASSGSGDGYEEREGRLTRTLLFAVLACAFGSSFQMGYHIGCINLPADLIKDWFTESYAQINGVNATSVDPKGIESIWALAVGIFAVGCMFGGLMVGSVADRLGRRSSLIYNNAIATCGAALMTGSKYTGHYWLFIVGRFVIGLNIGLNSGLAPMYFTEISPINMRGSIGSLFQLFVTIAILCSQIMGLPFVFGTPKRWPLIFAFTMIPVVVQLSTLPFCPESPKYSLIVRGRKQQAERDLKRLRGREDVVTELDQINKEAVLARSQPDVSVAAMFRAPFAWPLFLGIFMMIAQQFSGINAVMFYSTAIFKGAGLEGQAPNYATLAVGAVNAMITVVSVALIDRLGRRTLFISGLSGMALCHAAIAICMIISKTFHWFSFLSILFVLLFIVSAAIGPGSIPWFFVNEILPSNARGRANSVVVITNWGSISIIGILFPMLIGTVHEYVFFIFTILLVLFALFAIKFMPETKNKTLEEVQLEMDARRGRRQRRIGSNATEGGITKF